MNLKARFSLIGLGMILFLITTPLLVLYARGFKFDYKTGTITKTGAMVVKTDPDKAEIYLDGALVGQSPSNIRFLLPKDYEVEIKKDGYQTWSKRLNVASQFVTWVNSFREYIALFLSEPKLTENFITNAYSVSKNGNEIVFLQNDQYKLLNTKNGEVSNLGSNENVSFPEIGTANLQWTNADKVFESLQVNHSAAVLSLIKQARYLESNGEQMIILTSTNELYQYNLSTFSLIDNHVITASLAFDGIWYLQNQILKHKEFGSSSIRIVASDLPPFTTATIDRVNNKIFIVLDQTLYVLNDKLETIYTPVTYTNWDEAAGRLVFGNVNEIQIYNPTEKNIDLILRALEPIGNVQLNNETGYVFYSQKDNIFAIELDGRNRRNIFQIADNLGTNPYFKVAENGKIISVFDSESAKFYTIR